MYERTSSQAEVLASISALLWRYAPDDRVRAALGGDTENWYARRGHKYFLYEYELSRMGAGEQIPEFGYFTKKGNEQRTTEHILPQNPDSEAACWWDEFTSERHVALRHTLGNLVLTLDNSRYSNKCFDQKRGTPLASGGTLTACYAQAPLHQERDLAAYNDWTPASIRQRQDELTGWAMKRWHVESPDISVIEPEETEPEIEPEGEYY